MAKTSFGPVPANRLLAQLPKADFAHLAPHLEPVSLEFRQEIYEAGGPIEFAYFPRWGVLSALTVMEDGSAIEVGNIGNEGMAGLPVFVGAQTSPDHVIVQVPGEGLRIRADVLAKEVNRDGPLRQVMVNYHAAFTIQASYSVACNGLHSIQKRCCRWLLRTHDRVEADEVPMTHEFLAIILGVRRSSVSEVLLPLQERGLIRSRRGKITILDRPGVEAVACECYHRVREAYDRLMG